MSITLHRHELTLLPESMRVIIRPFIPSEAHRITTIIGRALALTEEETVMQVNAVKQEFEARHFDIQGILLLHYEKVKEHIFTNRPLSRERRLLIGALFSGEYALESAVLFNSSIVPHPDQSTLPEGGFRFLMSLRATGEGHISSVEFRVRTISAEGQIEIRPVSRFVTAPAVLANPSYQKKSFIMKLHEMNPADDFSAIGREFHAQ